MYNPYENNNKSTDNNDFDNQNFETNQNQPEFNTPHYNDNSYYTWSAQNTQSETNYIPTHANPVEPHVEPPKKAKSKFGRRLLAGALCCVFSATISVSAFALMLQYGVINVEGGDSNSAFTIAQVVDSNTNITDVSTVSALTPEEIAEKVVPSVVSVQSFAPMNTGFGFGQGSTQSTDLSPISEGSGVIMSEDGYIITNQHVIADATSYKIVLHDGTTYEATLVGGDEVTDLALLKIEATGLTVAEFGSANDLAVGEEVVAIGNPGGLSSTVTVGYVSALNREVTSDSGYTMNYIQTDAAINPGNSGGALVNEYGQVIGINTIKIVAEGYESLGFAIPTETVQPIISDLKEYGYVYDRAIVGISGQYLDSMTAGFYGLTAGMYVAEVTSEEAYAAGLKEGDIITSIDGVEVTTGQTITSVVTTKSPGDTVTLTVDRQLEGKMGIEITVTLSQYERVIADNPVGN